MKRFLLFLLTLSLLAACAPRADDPSQPVGSDDPNLPVSNEDPVTPKFDNTIPRHQDKDLLQEAAFVTSTDLLTMESFPLQFTLVINGDLPTPCNQLRVDVQPPTTDNKILVNVYSVVASDMMCTEMLQPFSENVPLGSFPAGHYTLWVNGEKVAEFDA